MSGGWPRAAPCASNFKAGGSHDVAIKRWPFSVEIKRREAWSLERVLAFKASPAWGWWAQCCRASREDKRAPMMWMRQSRGPWYVVLPGQWERSLARVLARSDVLGFAHDVVVAHAADLLALDPAVVVRAAKRFAALGESAFIVADFLSSVARGILPCWMRTYANPAGHDATRKLKQAVAEAQYGGQPSPCKWW